MKIYAVSTFRVLLIGNHHALSTDIILLSRLVGQVGFTLVVIVRYNGPGFVAARGHVLRHDRIIEAR